MLASALLIDSSPKPMPNHGRRLPKTAITANGSKPARGPAENGGCPRGPDRRTGRRRHAGREEVMQPAPELAAVKGVRVQRPIGDDTLRAIAFVERHQGMVDQATLAGAGEQDNGVNEVQTLAAVPRLLA